MNDFLLFAFASLMLNITPGNDMLYVATRSASQGVKAGIVSSLGIAEAALFIYWLQLLACRLLLPTRQLHLILSNMLAPLTLFILV
jgi:threonine/homoserine/homoserine lactone efflux protein